MECTFEQLKTHIRHRTNPNFWIVSYEEENKITLSNTQGSAFNHYEACHTLTEQMKNKYGPDCLVYRFQIMRQVHLEREHYHFVMLHQEKWFQCKVTTRFHESLQKGAGEWNRLSSSWLELYSIEKEVLPNMEEMRQTFVSMVRELPEFRLYYVTNDVEEMS